MGPGTCMNLFLAHEDCSQGYQNTWLTIGMLANCWDVLGLSGHPNGSYISYFCQETTCIVMYLLDIKLVTTKTTRNAVYTSCNAKYTHQNAVALVS